MNEQANIEARRRIQEELDRTNLRLDALRANRPEELESGGDNTPLSETSDIAQASEQRDSETQQIDWLVNRSVDLNDALSRIDRGTYGLCAVCGRAIEPERLRAVPEAALCLRDQADVERAHPHPAPSPGAHPLD
jgi:RNA polymerase-binding transcription factor DksA